MYVHTANVHSLTSSQAQTSLRPCTPSLSPPLHYSLAALTPSTYFYACVRSLLSRSPSLLFILFLLAVHWPLARVVENNCTASCSCPRSVRCQCRKTAALPLNRHTRCILSHAHVTSHLARALALALWQLQLHAQQAHCVWVCVRVWAAFYSPHRCCCWCRLNFFCFVCFAVARGLH